MKRNYEKIVQVPEITIAVLKGYNEINMIKISSSRTLLPQTQVTTFPYIPLVRTASETDSMGNTTYYAHDDFSRLETIKEKKEMPLEDCKYHYKN